MSKPEDTPKDSSRNDKLGQGSEAEQYIRDAAFRHLNPKQKPEFAAEMTAFWTWLLAKGVDIEDGDGQARTTAINNIKRVTRILPILWEEFSGYTLRITPEMCDWYVEQLKNDELTKQNGRPYAESTKRKSVCALLAFTRFRWDERSGDIWEPDEMFASNSRASPIADPLTLEERPQIREASLEFRTVKQYKNCTPEERDRIKQYLSQRLEKPKEEVSKEDWKKVNRCWKIPALVMLGLDTGLRPKEVEQAKVSWLDLESNKIRIPKDDAVKNDEYWENPVTARTAHALAKWREQRETRPKYDDTDLLFLTREGNPYSSGPLGRLLRSLMEEAGLDCDDRDISWYSLRHSLGTELALEGDLKQVQEQLRHKSIESTFKYLHPPDREIRDNLDKIS